MHKIITQHVDKMLCKKANIINRIILLFLSLISYFFTIAQTAITSASTTYIDNGGSTSDNYSASGSGESSFPSGSSYNIYFNNGSSNNLSLTNIVANSKTFVIDSRNSTATATINRKDNTNIPIGDSREVIMYESSSISGSDVYIKNNYISTMKSHLETTVINRGIDNIFMNGGQANYNNIERVDKVYSSNLATSNLTNYGFLVLERGGNDAFKIAAVTAVDGSGTPTSWGSIISVNNSTHWGATGTSFTTVDMKYDPVAVNTSSDNTTWGITPSNTPDSHFEPTVSLTSQNIKGVFISFSDLGISSNGAIYGFSLFCDDVNSSMSSSDIATLSNDTNYPPTSTGSTSGLDLINALFMVDNTVLPTHLLSFKTDFNDKENKLLWSTSDEQELSHFEIEISDDGHNFITMDTVKSYGKGMSITRYNYLITKELQNLSYFRLKLVNTDNSSTYSSIISNNPELSDLDIHLTMENKLLGLICPQNIDVSINIYNLEGSELYENQQFTCNHDFVDTSNFTEGLYIINLTTTSKKKQFKLLITK